VDGAAAGAGAGVARGAVPPAAGAGDDGGRRADGAGVIALYGWCVLSIAGSGRSGRSAQPWTPANNDRPP
jgi:hypothetical protein